jgi:hypothetical protein
MRPIVFLLLLAPSLALAQGQDAQTAGTAPQTQSRPAPLGSLSAVSVPGGRPVPVTPSQLPRPAGGDGFALPGPVALSAPQRLTCGAIADANARRACEALRDTPQPPGGPAR